MELSDLQKEIIYSDSNLKIDGIAGSGKTFLIPEFFKAHRKKKFLYIASNKGIMKNSKKHFRSLGLKNVRVETAHTLAWKRIGHKQINVRPNDYSPFELKQILKLDSSDIFRDLMIAAYVGKLVKCYCNSAAIKLVDTPFEKTIFNNTDLQFFWKHHDEILKYASILLQKIRDWEIPCYHEYYLKLYHLTSPSIQSDTIILDNGHSIAPCMFEVFNRQKAHKIIIGDTHQACLKNNYQINALHRSDFQSIILNESHRFNKNVSYQIRHILSKKKILFENFIAPDIKGLNNSNEIRNHAIIGRSKSGVLLNAIERIIINQEIDQFRFEGNFKEYYTLTDGTTIHDLLALYTRENARIQSTFARTLKSFENLEHYATTFNDKNCQGIINLVKEFGKELPSIIRRINKKIISPLPQENTGVTFSEVSYTSGLSFDEVTMLKDFDTMNLSNPEMVDINYQAIEEEINLQYLAGSRAQLKLNNPMEISESLKDSLPIYEEVNLPEIDKIDLSDKIEKADQIEDIYTLRRTKNVHKNLYEKWTSESDAQLVKLSKKHDDIHTIANIFQRTKPAIIERLKKLEDGE